MQRSWELLRQCKQLLEENGEKWKKSQERRELERKRREEREERLNRAKQKEEGWKQTKIQKKITDTLAELPKNKIEMVQVYKL